MEIYCRKYNSIDQYLFKIKNCDQIKLPSSSAFVVDFEQEFGSTEILFLMSFLCIIYASTFLIFTKDMAYKRFLLNSKSIPLQAPIGILPQERFLKLLRNRTVQ